MGGSMNDNLDALRALYVALGGEETEVADCRTSVEVLNAIAAKFGGDGDAVINAGAIANIAAVAGDMGGGDFKTATVIVTDDSTYKGYIRLPFLTTPDNGIQGQTTAIGTHTVVLYKGTAVLTSVTGTLYNAEIVGDAEFKNGDVYIHGDCQMKLILSNN